MQRFRFEDTRLEGVKVITPFFVEDNRGYFMKYFEKDVFRMHGIQLSSYEEFLSCSRKGTLRGLHFQKVNSQDKLIRVMVGEIFDVGVDLRNGSRTFGKWEGVILSEDNKKSVYWPKGFAHGFLALSEEAVCHYVCGDRFDPDGESGIIWNDAQLSISWPLGEGEDVILSERDRMHPTFAQYCREIDYREINYQENNCQVINCQEINRQRNNCQEFNCRDINRQRNSCQDIYCRDINCQKNNCQEFNIDRPACQYLDAAVAVRR